MLSGPFVKKLLGERNRATRPGDFGLRGRDSVGTLNLEPQRSRGVTPRLPRRGRVSVDPPALRRLGSPRARPSPLRLHLGAHANRNLHQKDVQVHKRVASELGCSWSHAGSMRSSRLPQSLAEGPLR